VLVNAVCPGWTYSGEGGMGAPGGRPIEDGAASVTWGVLLADGGPIGRRLDFLAQELNRESNTLTAKANDVELTNIGLELKSVVEQFREQVQNLE